MWTVIEIGCFWVQGSIQIKTQSQPQKKTMEAEFNPRERQHTIRFRQQECRQREREIKKGRETKKDREVERERGGGVSQRHKETVRDSEIWSAREREKEREKEGEKDKEREREREIERNNLSINPIKIKDFKARER